MDIGSKLQEKRQQMIESYLSDADTTSEQKLPIIDQFFTWGHIQGTICNEIFMVVLSMTYRMLQNL